VQIAVVQPADRDRVFVADLTAERAGLGETNVVGFGRRAATNDAWLRGDELASSESYKACAAARTGRPGESDVAGKHPAAPSSRPSGYMCAMNFVSLSLNAQGER
jgi:hypothetical protein